MKKTDVSYTRKVFGKNLKYYRFLNKFTQEQLGEKIDIDSTHISEMERGNKGASFETLTNIANALNIKVHQLFDETILEKNIPNDIRNFFYQ